jgi:hypothetical protein
MSDVALALVTQSAVVDDTCNHIGAAVFQISSGGTQVAPDAAVNVSIGQQPSRP